MASLERECLAFAAPWPLFLLLHGGFLVGGQCLSRRELLHLLLLQQKPSSSQGMHVIPYNEWLKPQHVVGLALAGSHAVLAEFRCYTQRCGQCLGLGGDAVGLLSFPGASLCMLETKGIPIL